MAETKVEQAMEIIEGMTVLEWRTLSRLWRPSSVSALPLLLRLLLRLLPVLLLLLLPRKNKPNSLLC